MRKRITYGAVLPVDIDEAFTFVSDPRNWSLFLPSTKSVELEGWGHAGGKARLVVAFMGREVTSQLEITEWERPARFRYVMTTAGYPQLDNLREFEDVAEGTRLRGTTTSELRPGLAGLFDRIRAWAFRRTIEKGMERLPAAVRAHRSAT